MLVRDEKMLADAIAHNADIVIVDMRSGYIVGYSTIGDTYRVGKIFKKHFEQGLKNFETMNVWEYDWLTDPNRKTVVRTVADEYENFDMEKFLKDFKKFMRTDKRI